MINRYPLWKNALVVLVLVFGILYSLPNLYGKDPAVLIGPSRGAHLTEQVHNQILEALKKAGIGYKRVSMANGKLEIRFASTDEQLRASERLETVLGTRFTVAQALAPATPGWLRDLNAKPMYLGLDLQGGIHFLMQVDMSKALVTDRERYTSDIRSLLREKGIRHLGVTTEKNDVRMRFRTAEVRDKARAAISHAYPGLTLTESDGPKFYFLYGKLSDAQRKQVMKYALEQNITTLRNRVNELGVAEPVIQQQGNDRIVVELPGVQNPEEAKNILGATATLQFRLMDPRTDNIQSYLASGHIPAGTELFHRRDGRPILLSKRVILTGDSIQHAASTIDQQSGTPAVSITLDDKGGRRFDDFTKDHVGDYLAVVYTETKVQTHMENGKRIRQKKTIQEVISVAVIKSRLGRRFQIEGLDSPQEAHTLALLLRAGSLAAPIEIIEERTVGPSLGRDNIRQGFNAVVVGFLLVVAGMAIYYRMFGIVADVGLAFNLVVLVALLSLLQATLTMPGIAGIVLTVGMAVDANVLIYERIREELRAGNTPQASIHAGYEKAFATIADANVTTLIAAVVLFGFGTGPVKGFAVTLSLGILVSMFTCIVGTRAVINWIYGGRRLKKLSI
jgi:preprotein translocase subunit SecD